MSGFENKPEAAAARRQSSNPFDSPEGAGSPAENAPVAANPTSSNPFDEPATAEEAVTPTAARSAAPTAPVVRNSGNPFGEGDKKSPAPAGSGLPPQAPGSSSNPIGFPMRRESNVLNRNLNASAPTSLPLDSNSADTMCVGLGGTKIEFPQAVECLLNMGFLPEYARPSLLATRDVRQSIEVLTQKVQEICLVDAYGTAPGLWKSPMAVRVASWMPVKDAGSGGATVTLYYISVTILQSNVGYQITKRYSEFHGLYLALYNDLVKSFARKGMQNLFPDDRVSSWFSGESDALRNSRREYLDGWLREVCLSATLMLQSGPRAKIYEFLGADKYLPMLPTSRASPKPPASS